MSILWTCDWCGQPIDGNAWLKLKATHGVRAGCQDGWVAHYHVACYENDVEELLKLIHSAGKSLENIPVAVRGELEAATQPDEIDKLSEIGELRLWDGDVLRHLARSSDAAATILYWQWPLRHAGFVQFADLQHAVKTNGLMRARRIGPKRAAELARAITTLAAELSEAVNA